MKTNSLSLSLSLLALVAACTSSRSSPSPSRAAAPAPAPAPRRPAEIRHSFLTSGRVTGAQVETRAPDGSRIVKFHFDDRGRGPELTVRIWAGEDESPARIDITGVDSFKRPVREQYVREGTQARWQSQSERGSQKVDGPAFYLAMNGAPEGSARLVRAALAGKTGRIAIRPPTG